MKYETEMVLLHSHAQMTTANTPFFMIQKRIAESQTRRDLEYYIQVGTVFLTRVHLQVTMISEKTG